MKRVNLFEASIHEEGKRYTLYVLNGQPTLYNHPSFERILSVKDDQPLSLCSVSYSLSGLKHPIPWQ